LLVRKEGRKEGRGRPHTWFGFTSDCKLCRSCIVGMISRKEGRKDVKEGRKGVKEGTNEGSIPRKEGRKNGY
jgi:hypothetical protein